MYSNVVTVKGGSDIGFALDCHNFWLDTEVWMFTDDPGDKQLMLERLAYKVSRKPVNLLAHLRRIYWCHQNQLAPQLYAALMDLLIVLNGRGLQLSRKLIIGCASRLDPQSVKQLRRLAKKPQRLPSNIYSLFATGVIGSFQLVDYSHHNIIEHDFLTLANDFIEYSQLDEAMDVLEQGLAMEPEHQEGQDMLLQLYKSTGSHERFCKQYQLLLETGQPMLDGWAALKQIFDGKSV